MIVHKVSNEKPPIDKHVLVYTERFGWTQGKYYGDDKWWTLDDLSAYEEIIWWCNEPEIPKQ